MSDSYFLVPSVFDTAIKLSKHVDTIKKIAYYAETGMANRLRESLTRPDEVRSLLREFIVVRQI